ncbi:hypothetical protein N7449_000144 [Penicillium cf. viridicatum]|uniref:Uncharacterized protein n=1 Tax=Penicillium cf. viridicatum TaxID=2972119 RepID=A0A9W9T915_9EURO|nr:hypothetical protein N7449_000144 [Penicillium cf. viridicatum]
MAANMTPIATFKSPFPRHFYDSISRLWVTGSLPLPRTTKQPFLSPDHAVRIPFAQFVNLFIEYGLPISSARFVKILASSRGVSSDEISWTVAFVYIHWLGTSLEVLPGHDNDIEQVMRYLECIWEAQTGGDLLQELNVEVILT